MSKSIRILVAACLLLAPASPHASAMQADPPAQPAPLELFEAGVASYRAGNLEAARQQWLASLRAEAETPMGLDLAAVYHNLGNAAFRLERPVEASAWYTAGILLEPRDSDLWANVELARARAQMPPADRGDLRATLDRLARQLTLPESEWLVLACALLWGAALGWEALRGGRDARLALLGSTCVLALACIPWGLCLREAGRDTLFVIAPGGAPLRSEPNAAATSLTTLAAGTLGERIDGLPGWVRLELEDSRRGWIRADDVLRLRAPATPPDAPAQP